MPLSSAQADALLDYALGQAEPIQRQETEQALQQDPELMLAYDKLLQTLAPLQSLRGPIAPPEGLFERTLAAIPWTTNQSSQPKSSLEPTVSPRGTTWAAVADPDGSSDAASDASGWLHILRRSLAGFRLDYAALVGCLGLAVGLGLVFIGKARQEQQLLACQDQLRALHVALMGYADTHAGRLPEVGSSQLPRPAWLAAALSRQGQWAADRSLICPSWAENQSESASSDTVWSPPAAPAAPGWSYYAYTLGYRPDSLSPVQGIRLGTASAWDHRAIAADAPSPSPSPRATLPLATNLVAPATTTDTQEQPHSRGRNVLFLAGHVQVLRGTQIGPRPDDIYRNHHGWVRAGVRIDDVCLGGEQDVP